MMRLQPHLDSTNGRRLAAGCQDARVRSVLGLISKLNGGYDRSARPEHAGMCGETLSAAQETRL